MGDVTLFEPAGDQPHQEKQQPHAQPRYQSRSLAECISNVSTPPGGKKPILKTMLTTACERNCYYCPFRAGRSRTERVTISPDEMAKGFDTLQHAGQVDGLFLSSGIIKGSVTTQDKLLDTADILRRRYRYRGYIHLKIMPGVEFDQLHRAMQLAGIGSRSTLRARPNNGLICWHRRRILTANCCKCSSGQIEFAASIHTKTLPIPSLSLSLAQ